MRSERMTAIAVATACALLVCALLGQAVTDAQAVGGTTDTGKAIGRAGFAYLSGFRVFAASILWNRLDTVMHEYYGGVSLDEQTFIMPSVRLINALDPQLIEAYYVVGFVLASRGDTETAFACARQGVENNPDSGLLRMSYAQVLYLFGDDSDMAESLAQADYAMDKAAWRDALEQHDAFSILASIYKKAGDKERFDATQKEIERLDLVIGDAVPSGAHDHDGDGTPDH